MAGRAGWARRSGGRSGGCFGGRLAALAGALFASTAAPAVAGCGDGWPLRAQAAGVELGFAPQPPRIAVGRHFAVEGVACGIGGATATVQRVDAEMPAHRHGMNYRATVTIGEGGRFSAHGLMFHMPGRWRFIFDVGTPSGPARVTREVDVE